MEMTMGETNVDDDMGDDELGREHGPNGPGRMSLDDLELANRAKELGRKAKDWIALNPFAALGIAMFTGFLAGRAMRTWALRL